MTRWGIATGLLFLSTISTAYATELVIGSIKTVQKSCSIQRGTETIPATEGMHLLVQDALITGPDGHTAVMMRDGTRLSLGPNTELKFDKFSYDPMDGEYALLLDLGRGILAYISGKIASFSPESVKVQTPVGILGLRGTQFVVGLDVPRGVQ